MGTEQVFKSDVEKEMYLKIVRLESMVIFLLEKLGSEQSRRPISGESVLNADDPRVRVHYFQSYFAEWQKKWDEKIKESDSGVTP